jgi:pimeloyl-ACP methyl ester carboxylesterase
MTSDPSAPLTPRPLAPAERSVTIGDGRLAALTNERWLDGSTRARSTVLFIPGYTGSKEDFTPLLRPLAEHGVRAVAVDQLGQYESSWGQTAQDYRIDSLAADVLQILAELRANALDLHLVGHSFGGLVARAAVLAATEGAGPDSLTLMDSGPGPIPGRRLAALELAEPVLRSQGLTAVWDLISSEAAADPKFARASPALREFLRRRFMANDPVGLLVMGQELRTVADRTRELAALGPRALVLHGADDDAWPPGLQAAMAVELDAAHAVIPNAAHSPAVENAPETLRALLAFWTGS